MKNYKFLQCTQKQKFKRKIIYLKQLLEKSQNLSNKIVFLLNNSTTISLLVAFKESKYEKSTFL